jgi:hypothetical protein
MEQIEGTNQYIEDTKLVNQHAHDLGQGAALEARTCFDRALTLLPDDRQEERWRALYGRTVALGVLGERAAWEADLQSLLDLAQRLGDDQRLTHAYLFHSLYQTLSATSTGQVVWSARHWHTRRALRCSKRTVMGRWLTQQSRRAIAC